MYPDMPVTLTREEWRTIETYLKPLQEEASKTYSKLGISDNVRKAYYDDWVTITKLLNKVRTQLKGE